MHSENGRADEGRLSRLLSESYLWVDRLRDQPPGADGEWPEEVIDAYANDLDEIRDEAQYLFPADATKRKELLDRLDGFCLVMSESYATSGSASQRLSWLHSDEGFAWEERLKLDPPPRWSSALVEDWLAELREIRVAAAHVTDPNTDEAEDILRRLAAFWTAIEEGYGT